jgi:hypothetical protein
LAKPKSSGNGIRFGSGVTVGVEVKVGRGVGVGVGDGVFVEVGTGVIVGVFVGVGMIEVLSDTMGLKGVMTIVTNVASAVTEEFDV